MGNKRRIKRRDTQRLCEERTLHKAKASGKELARCLIDLVLGMRVLDELDSLFTDMFPESVLEKKKEV